MRDQDADVEYRVWVSPRLRCYVWRTPRLIWRPKVWIWREAEGPWVHTARFHRRIGPPWRWCVRVLFLWWHVHLGFGRYRVVL